MRIALALLAIGSLATAQQTLVVPTQYATIQAAVDAANPHDTVLVLPGTYPENVTIQKVLTLVSRDGPASTTIRAPNGGSVILVTAPATIDGFTIRDGVASALCILSCSSISAGGGILYASGVVIRNNIIVNNSAGGSNCLGVGGGVGSWFGGPVILVNNVIANNRAWSGMCVAHGGGAALGAGSVAAHNLFFNNFATVSTTFGAQGGGLYGPVAATNCVFWMNRVDFGAFGTHVGGGATTVNCLVGVDPLVMDHSRGDYHLRYDSPARDLGVATASSPPTDWEGDPRTSGPAPDAGPDEFHEHVYTTGNQTPGGLMHVKITGPPNAAVTWAYTPTPTLRSPPLVIPGVGSLWLNPPLLINPAGTLPSTGVVIVPVPLPAALPTPLDIPIQALVGSTLTNPHIVRIR